MKITIVYTSAAEIKAAPSHGVRVYWSRMGYDPDLTGYEVIKDSIGQYLIAFLRGTPHASYIGLTWQGGATLNGKACEFFSVVQAP